MTSRLGPGMSLTFFGVSAREEGSPADLTISWDFGQYIHSDHYFTSANDQKVELEGSSDRFTRKRKLDLTRKDKEKAVGAPPKESVGAPDQMTVSQHSKSEG